MKSLSAIVVALLLSGNGLAVCGDPAGDAPGAPRDGSQVGSGEPISEPFDGGGLCVEVCNLAFDTGCGVHSDCVTDCEADLQDCPEAMEAVLLCHLEADMTCVDPAEEDQGIEPGPCADEHDAVHECGHDPF